MIRPLQSPIRWPRQRALLPLAALLVSACSGNNAGLISVSGNASGATSLVVNISVHGTATSSRFTVPDVEAGPVKLPTRIAVTFPSTVSGYLDVRVDGAAGGKVVSTGEGFSNTPAVKGGVTEIAVVLEPAAPGGAVDGGAGAMDLAGRD